MKNLSNYLNSLEYAYAISYSGLRGPEFQQHLSTLEGQLEQAQSQIETANLKEKIKLKRLVKRISDEIQVLNSTVLFKSGELHKSVQEIYRFEKETPEMTTILNILQIPYEEQWIAACMPIYRDLIVFYAGNDEIAGVLQICFSCQSLIDEQGVPFEVDNKIFQLLRKELSQIGHKIEKGL